MDEVVLFEAHVAHVLGVRHLAVLLAAPVAQPVQLAELVAGLLQRVVQVQVIQLLADAADVVAQVGRLLRQRRRSRQIRTALIEIRIAQIRIDQIVRVGLEGETRKLSDRSAASAPASGILTHMDIESVVCFIG